MKALLLGAGNSRLRKLRVDPEHKADFSDTELVTLDIDVDSKPDVQFDLNRLHYGEPLPFQTGEFEEIHAYEVLEHFGRQGDYFGFFTEFSEYWRVLKPGGYFLGSVPHHTSMWAWGDPGHTRCLPEGVFVFLEQDQYKKQIGKTALTDYRSVWDKNFTRQFIRKNGENLFFVLKKEEHGKEGEETGDASI
jgi:SAM-dependent methyltransferase